LVISDGGPNFIDKTIRQFLAEYGVKHNIVTPYHPQTSGHAETSNKQIKNILQKAVDEMGKKWKYKLHDALWAYQTTYKTPNVCHLISLYMKKYDICLLNWNLGIIGQSRNGTWISI